jgi:glycosyltransferase involved in cell wall biosynthesis
VPTASIVIALFNKERFIQRTLLSVVAQTLRDIEIIVVDDGSTDDSLAVVHQVRDPRIKVFCQQNMGVESARNRGFRASRGEFVGFVDADDLLHPKRLEIQIAKLRTAPMLAAVATWAKKIDTRDRYRGRIRTTVGSDDLQYQLLFGNPVVNASVLIRRAALEQVGGYRTGQGSRFAEDYDLWLRLSQVGSIDCLPEYLTSYRVVSNSRSQTVGVPLQKSADELALQYLCSALGEAETKLLATLIQSLNSLQRQSDSGIGLRDLVFELRRVQNHLKTSFMPRRRILIRQLAELVARYVLASWLSSRTTRNLV